MKRKNRAMIMKTLEQLKRMGRNVLISKYPVRICSKTTAAKQQGFPVWLKLV